ncbi:MAG: histone deacetylase [Thermodesulfobacteriota bacterium]
MQPVLVTKDRRFIEHLDRMPHLESSRRIRATYALLEDSALAGRFREVIPRPAVPDEIALVHSRNYIDRIAKSAGRALTSFDLDTQATEKSYETACLAVGAVCSLLDEMLAGNAKRGFAFVRPPGHHAEPEKAMGFCLFNNIAVGARYLKETYSVKKIMIVDIDAHHGNGTQAAFYDSDDVLYVSLHQFPGFPGTGKFGDVGRGRGEGFTVNIPLGKGCSDRDIARIIYYLINPLAISYQPEIILVSCGFDLYIGDRLAGMRVTPEGYALITFFLLNIAERVCGGRILFVMEGGYSIQGIRECGLRVMQELCNVPTLTPAIIERVPIANAARLSILKKVFDVQKKYWNNLGI